MPRKLKRIDQIQDIPVPEAEKVLPIEEVPSPVIETPEWTATEIPTSSADEVKLPLGSLPSGGKFYSSNIVASPLEFDEIVLVDNIRKDNHLEMYDLILQRRVSGVHPHEIMVGDEQYMLIWIREQSFPGYPYRSGKFKCAKCGKVHETGAEFPYSSFVFETNASVIANDRTEVTLKSGKTFTIFSRRRFHNHYTKKHLNDVFYSKGIKVPDGYENSLKMAAVLGIPGCRDAEDRIKYLSSLTPLEVIELFAHIKHNTFVTRVWSTVECTGCKTPNKVAFFFQPSYFVPDYIAER